MRNTFFLILFVVMSLHVPPATAGSATPKSPVILAFGDSLTAGYGLNSEEAFPVQLEKQLKAEGYDVTVINSGVSGDTTAGGLARLDWALADKPEIVIVELGANDALRGLDPDHTYANLDRILTRLKADGCLVILAGMRAPRNFGQSYYTKFDQIFPALAERHGLLLYPFFLAGVATDPGLNLADGIHPNAEGVQRIVAGIKPLVITALTELEASGVGH